MGKLMKYELKSLMKFVLSVLILLIIFSTVLQYNIFNIVNNNSEFNQSKEVFKALAIGLSGLVLWGSYLVSFFYIVNSFNKELTEDKGYLTFTLPVNGYEILGSKVLSALIYFIVLAIGLVLYNMLIGTFFLNKAGIDIKDVLKTLLNINIGFQEVRLVIVSFIFVLLRTISVLVLVYFSMTLRKLLFGGKRMNGIWFILFLVISSIVGFITLKLAFKFPYFLDLYTFKLSTIPEFFNVYNTPMEGFITNITQIVVGIVITLIGFFATGYMLDKKIEI